MLISVYDLLVNEVAGGFWLAVLMMVVVMFLILAMGRVSAWTNLTYNGIFVFVMALGYGYRLVSILLWALIMIWAWSEILKFFKFEF